MSPWLVMLVAGAAALDEGRYLMTVAGVPVGVVAFERRGPQVVYRSSQVFRSSERELVVTLPVDGPPPETWWLSRLRDDGCTKALEERTRAVETVCTKVVSRDEKTARADVDGTINEAAFHATYERGVLTVLNLASSGVAFERSTQPLPRGGDPFSKGFAVSSAGPKAGGDYVVVPSTPADGLEAPRVEGAAEQVHAREDDSCLTLARQLAAKFSGASVVSGVVIEGGRAWPHAWVKTAVGQHLDPTVPSTAAPRPYLAFTKQPGALYLALLSGQRRVERR